MIGANLSEPNMDVKSSLNVCNGSVAKPNPQKGGGVMSSEYGSYKIREAKIGEAGQSIEHYTNCK